MPVYHNKKDGQGCYILTSLSGQVITYQLTPEGRQTLNIAGIHEGGTFGRALLLGLIQSGHAFTYGTGIRHTPDSDKQLGFDFPDDDTPESAIPVCSKCSSAKELHLVTMAGKAEGSDDAFMLCRECRTKIDGIDASLPVPMVTRSIIGKLKDWGLFGSPDTVVKAYIERLNTNFEKMWDDHRARRVQPKSAKLPLDRAGKDTLF